MTRQDIMASEGFLVTWDTQELQESFEVLGFCLGFCVVKCKASGKKGSLSFDRYNVEGKPARLYHSLVWDK